MAIHQDLTQMSREDLIAALQAKQAPRAVTWKVSEKGALSIYGLGRFPVTLYAAQWERIFANVPALTSFITANAATLSRK